MIQQNDNLMPQKAKCLKARNFICIQIFQHTHVHLSITYNAQHLLQWKRVVSIASRDSRIIFTAQYHEIMSLSFAQVTSQTLHKHSICAYKSRWHSKSII